MKIALVSLAFILMPEIALAQVVISEVHWVGSDLSTADEWFELAAIESTDLFGWRITSQNSKGEEKDILIFDDTQVLTPGNYFLISNYGETKSQLAVTPNAITSAVSLPNSKLLLRLYNASGSLVDEVDDGIGAPFAGGKNEAGDVYKSMERIDFLASGSEKSNWRTAEVSIGFNEDALLFGTPGSENRTEKNSSSSISSSSSSSSYSSFSSFSSYSSSSIPKIFINEVLANPKGKDDAEWIELLNADTQSFALQGWKLHVDNQEFIFPDTGIILVPGEYISLRKSFTDLSLRNKGDLIQLWSGSILVHELEYSNAPSGVSYGKLEEDLLPFCKPTEGKPNKKIDQQVIIHMQSGKTKGEGKVTLNLEALTFNGSIDVVSCYWEYSDGFRSDSCNPPSHTFEDEGVFSVELRASTICGDSIVEVLHGKVYPLSSSSVRSSIESSVRKATEETKETKDKIRSSFSSSKRSSSKSSRRSSSKSSKRSSSKSSRRSSSSAQQKVAAAFTQVRYEPLPTKYEHVMPESSSGSVVEKSQVLAMFQDQIIEMPTSQNPKTPASKFPFELALFLAFVLPGWWFLRTGFQKKYSAKR